MSTLFATTLRKMGFAVLASGALIFSTELAARDLPAETTSEAIDDCEHLGSVQAHSGYGKHGGIHWEQIAKGRALRKADDSGATHIVWESAHGRGAFNGSVQGTMYDCE